MGHYSSNFKFPVRVQPMWLTHIAPSLRSFLICNHLGNHIMYHVFFLNVICSFIFVDFILKVYLVPFIFVISFFLSFFLSAIFHYFSKIFRCFLFYIHFLFVFFQHSHFNPPHRLLIPFSINKTIKHQYTTCMQTSGSPGRDSQTSRVS